jgi:hypothetical protein
MEIEESESTETPEYKIQALGNHPEEKYKKPYVNKMILNWILNK